MKKILFVILLFSFTNVFALEMCSPSEEFNEYMNLSEDEKYEYVKPLYCDELKSINELSSVPYKFNNTIGASASDSSYTSPYVTSIKNQYSLGTCWAFSSISAVESNALKKGLGYFDLSESHMIYSTISAAYSDEAGKYGKYNVSSFTGGKVTYAASYFFNNYGQLTESEMPYKNEEKKITLSQYKTGRNIISPRSFEVTNINEYSVCSKDEISDIKNRIINYGAVQGSMYYDENLFLDSNMNYYLSDTSDSSLPNHGISIVGWDDNAFSGYSKLSNKGGWLVKNSWGTSWSSDGYFYISYEDNFICKNISSFYDVSTTSYDNTYTSADMVGDTIIMFNNTFYISSKFSLKTDNENIKRVSYPVGPNMTYYVYLSKSNNLTNQSDWVLLTHGSSKNVGIKSIDISNSKVSDDFTIIVKYVVSSGNKSSVFTMCNAEDDTKYMNISSNTNYYSFNSTKWNDMNNVTLGSTSIACEPNLFVYTDSVNSNNTYVKIDNVINVNDVVSVSISLNNVSTSSLSYKIKDTSNKDVTSSFTIIPNYSKKTISIKGNGSISGSFNFIIEYNNSSVKTTFDISEIVTSKDNSFVRIDGNYMYVSIPLNYNLTFSDLISKLTIKNTSVSSYNSSNTSVSNSSSVTTASKLKTNNKSYNIVILGDVTGNGKISASDVMKVATHVIRGNVISESIYLKASDVTKDGKVTLADVMKLATFVIKGGRL